MMIERLFGTPLFIEYCNFDLKRFELKCREFQSKIDSESVSNRGGGYQGHGFVDDKLNKKIIDSIVRVPDKEISNLSIMSWVNINSPGSWNERHSHDPYSGTFLSGVFYIKTPKDSGNIRFYDPRPNIATSSDMRYYNNGYNIQWYTPEPNMLMIFPPWLEHDVEMNNSDEDRISISFNIINAKF